MRISGVIALAFLAACSRDFSPPVAPAVPPPSGLGAGCAGAEECGSGLCIDGVCCASECEPDQVCNDPRSVGHCRETQLGDRCEANARCGSGHCVDGVCCDIACEGDCQSCALPGFIGQCEPVPENTNPRDRCAKPCGACREGSCGPAVVGTDPKGLCVAGQVCGAFGTCGGFDGGGCASDGDCAQGQCLDGRCLEIEVTEIQTPEMLPADAPGLFRWSTGLARGLGAQTAVLFTEGQGDATGGRVPAAHDLMLALVERGGAMRSIDLLVDRGTDFDEVNYDQPIASAVVAFHGGYYVVAGPQSSDFTDCTTGPRQACTVVGWYVSGDGQAGPREVVAQQPLGYEFRDLHLSAVDGGLVAEFEAFVELPDGGFPTVREYDLRDPDGGWRSVRSVYEPAGRIAGIAQTGTGTWVVGIASSSEVYLERIDGSARSTHPLSLCSGLPLDALHFAARGAGFSPTLLDLLVTGGCTLSSAGTRPLQHLTVDTANPDALVWSAAEDAGAAADVALFPGYAGDGAEVDDVRLGYADESGLYGGLRLRFRPGTAANDVLLFTPIGQTWVGPMQVGVDRSNLPAVVFSPIAYGNPDEVAPRLVHIGVYR